MNNFLDSKHFNRCKRLHPLTSAALKMLHLEQYLSIYFYDFREVSGLVTSNFTWILFST